MDWGGTMEQPVPRKKWPPTVSQDSWLGARYIGTCEAFNCAPRAYKAYTGNWTRAIGSASGVLQRQCPSPSMKRGILAIIGVNASDLLYMRGFVILQFSI